MLAGSVYSCLRPVQILSALACKSLWEDTPSGKPPRRSNSFWEETPTRNFSLGTHLCLIQCALLTACSVCCAVLCDAGVYSVGQANNKQILSCAELANRRHTELMEQLQLQAGGNMES
jgi:hypothetical protein